MEEKLSYDDPPSVKALDEGYNQTYLIMTKDYCLQKEKIENSIINGKNSANRGTMLSTSNNSDGNPDGQEVFFRCGNWCYKGLIQFNELEIGIEDLPILIPTLQRQQGSLRYYCNSKSVPPDSDFADPLTFLEDACEFIAQELISANVEKELQRMTRLFPWIDEDSSSTYFELSLGNVPDFMNKIELIANKTYTRGLIIVSIYYKSSIYFVVQSGEGDQPLLDVRFPDVSRHGQGLHINTYNDHVVPYRKLTLWHIVEGFNFNIKKQLPKIKTLNVSSKNYEQTYCVLKSSFDRNIPNLSIHHDALFRFGSWCYSGRVQLTPTIALSDIPYVIPALRMQQSRLDYLCDVSQVPTTSPFAPALEYVQYLGPRMAEQIVASEETLRELLERLESMGMGDSVTKWLDGDPSDSFFEFKIDVDPTLSETFKNVELIVSKCYHSTGIITITIIYQHTIYVSLQDGNKENPLLDSRFPDVSGKGRGYQLQSYNTGSDNWPSLRKVSLWQTLSSLEKEFRDRAVQLAQAKSLKLNEKVGLKGESTSSHQVEQMEQGGQPDSMDSAESEKRHRPSSKRLSRHVDPETDISLPPLSDDETADDKSTNIINNQTTARKVSASLDDGEEDSLNRSVSSPEKSTATTTSPSILTSLGPVNAVSRRISALPHHIPKNDGLSKKLEEIRRTMGEEGMRAPWDAKGKPLRSQLEPSSSMNGSSYKK